MVGDAFSAGSSFQEGLGHAIVFGATSAVLTFPVLVGIGFFLRWVAEMLLHRPLPYRTVLPWFVHLPLSVALLFSTIPDSPETLFRRYVADDVPHSLSDLRYWQTSGFNSSIVMMSFKLDPSEFSKVLSRHEYAESSESTGVSPPNLAGWARGRPDFPITLPAAPLVYRYSYSKPTPSVGLRIRHYATKDKDQVITVWTFN